MFDDTASKKKGLYHRRCFKDLEPRCSQINIRLPVIGNGDLRWFHVHTDQFSFHGGKEQKEKAIQFEAKTLQQAVQKRKKTKEGSFWGQNGRKNLTIRGASVIKMIKYAVRKGITADYVLTDSWFSCWEVVETSINNGLKFIGMFSKVKTLFTYNKKALTYKEIRWLNKKRIKRNKRFNLYYIRTVADWKGQKVVLYFTRRGKRGNWRTIVSTDLKLDFNKTVEVYQIRWSMK